MKFILERPIHFVREIREKKPQGYLDHIVKGGRGRCAQTLTLKKLPILERCVCADSLL